MRRSDRLYHLIQILRDGRLHRASDLAAQLGVSTRTIWRDMAVLMASGMPVEGERGVGYLLRAPLALPPMILTGDEIAALRHGLALVAGGVDAGLARAARSLAAKLASVTPAPPEPDPLFAEAPVDPRPAPPVLPQLRAAIRAREVLLVTHIDADGAEQVTRLRPLGLELTGSEAALIAAGDPGGGFQRVPIARIVRLAATGAHFTVESAPDLAEWQAWASNVAAHEQE